MDPSKFLTTTLRAHPMGQAVTRIMAAALEAVDPGSAVRANLVCDGEALIVSGHRFALPEGGRILLVAAGKAAASMAQAACEILGERLSGGVIVTKDGHTIASLSGAHIRQCEAGHPLPDERGVRATHEIIELARQAGEGDLVLCLISGGGSALLTAPVPEIGLESLSGLTGRLLASGADIHEFNTVRKHLSLVKGGRLARLAAPAQVITLILSDVVGDDLDVIASGPTVPDPSTFADAAAVLEKYGLETPSYIEKGLRGQVPDTPKPGDPVFRTVQNLLIGTNRQAAQAALTAAGRIGLETRLLTSRMTGEAAEAGTWLAEKIGEMPPQACWIAGGETTVTLGENTGLGGRNQETALAAVAGMAAQRGRLLITLATDGGDGPTDAAGAAVSTETLARARRLGMDPSAYLSQHNAYPFFEALGDLIKTGPTRTNVNDLAFLFSLER